MRLFFIPVVLYYIIWSAFLNDHPSFRLPLFIPPLSTAFIIPQLLLPDRYRTATYSGDVRPLFLVHIADSVVAGSGSQAKLLYGCCMLVLLQYPATHPGPCLPLYWSSRPQPFWFGRPGKNSAITDYKVGPYLSSIRLGFPVNFTLYQLSSKMISHNHYQQ